MNTNKALVLAGIKGVFVDRDPTVLDRLFSEDYQQHNPQIPNGTAAIKALLGNLPADFRSQPGLVVAEGNYVTTHGRFRMGTETRWWLWISSASPMARSPNIGMSCRKRCRRRKALTTTAADFPTRINRRGGAEMRVGRPPPRP